MSDAQQDILSTLFGFWKGVADETNRILGKETAGFLIYLHNDALDIFGAINDAYAQEEWLCSLACAEFLGLLKELSWLQVLFLCGNYPIVLSRLRFNWERIFRALYADTYAQEHPTATDVPGPTLDDKHDWLMKREDRLNWRTLIAPTLSRLFAADAPGDAESHFKPLWDRLNRCVHPSGDLREKLIGDSALHLLDAFDEQWAQEARADAVEVFGLIFLAILSRFPAVVPALVADPHMFPVCPQLRAVLR
jgi:hypothetical protein